MIADAPGVVMPAPDSGDSAVVEPRDDTGAIDDHAVTVVPSVVSAPESYDSAVSAPESDESAVVELMDHAGTADEYAVVSLVMSAPESDGSALVEPRGHTGATDERTVVPAVISSGDSDGSAVPGPRIDTGASDDHAVTSVQSVMSAAHTEESAMCPTGHAGTANDHSGLPSDSVSFQFLQVPCDVSSLHTSPSSRAVVDAVEHAGHGDRVSLAADRSEALVLTRGSDVSCHDSMSVGESDLVLGVFAAPSPTSGSFAPTAAEERPGQSEAQGVVPSSSDSACVNTTSNDALILSVADANGPGQPQSAGATAAVNEAVRHATCPVSEAPLEERASVRSGESLFGNGAEGVATTTVTPTVRITRHQRLVGLAAAAAAAVIEAAAGYVLTADCRGVAVNPGDRVPEIDHLRAAMTSSVGFAAAVESQCDGSHGGTKNPLRLAGASKLSDVAADAGIKVPTRVRPPADSEEGVNDSLPSAASAPAAAAAAAAGHAGTATTRLTRHMRQAGLQSVGLLQVAAAASAGAASAAATAGESNAISAAVAADDEASLASVPRYTKRRRMDAEVTTSTAVPVPRASLKSRTSAPEAEFNGTLAPSRKRGVQSMNAPSTGSTATSNVRTSCLRVAWVRHEHGQARRRQFQSSVPLPVQEPASARRARTAVVASSSGVQPPLHVASDTGMLAQCTLYLVHAAVGDALTLPDRVTLLVQRHPRVLRQPAIGYAVWTRPVVPCPFHWGGHPCPRRHHGTLRSVVRALCPCAAAVL